MKYVRIPKGVQYGEPVAGKFGCPQLRYSDVCTRDVKELFVDLSKWEELTTVSREVVFKPL